MKTSNSPTPDQLRNLLSYSPGTGEIRFRERGPEWFSAAAYPEKAAAAWNKGFTGKVTFATPHMGGYSAGRIAGSVLLAHRVAWALHYGEWPRHEIDHINGDRTDNRISNLRDVHHSLNQRNRKLRSDNTSGADGVSWNAKCGFWYVTAAGKYVGIFKDFDQAVAARKAEERKHDYHPNHGRPT